MSKRYESTTEGRSPGSGFEAWKQRRQEKGLDLTSDAAYEAYLDAASGLSAQESAGVVHASEPGMGAVDLNESAEMSDDQAYFRYLGELDGTAARRRSEATARQERRDRQAEHQRHAEHHGTPVPSFYRDGV